jgi:hypothetical protein
VTATDARTEDLLGWLMGWYARHCDGQWEHGHGVRIDSIDNPGWCLRIDLAGTDLAGRAFEPLSHGDEFEGPWWERRLEGTEFVGYGGATELAELIRVFRRWAEERIN